MVSRTFVWTQPVRQQMNLQCAISGGVDDMPCQSSGSISFSRPSGNSGSEIGENRKQAEKREKRVRAAFKRLPKTVGGDLRKRENNPDPVSVRTFEKIEREESMNILKIFAAGGIAALATALMSAPLPVAAQQADGCVTVRAKSDGGSELFNTCPFDVSVRWCEQEPPWNACEYNMKWNIRSGGTYSIGRGKSVQWQACRGRDTLRSKPMGLYVCEPE